MIFGQFWAILLLGPSKSGRSLWVKKWITFFTVKKVFFDFKGSFFQFRFLVWNFSVKIKNDLWTISSNFAFAPIKIWMLLFGQKVDQTGLLWCDREGGREGEEEDVLLAVHEDPGDDFFCIILTNMTHISQKVPFLYHSGGILPHSEM